jgi:hypothetical protein
VKTASKVIGSICLAALVQPLSACNSFEKKANGFAEDVQETTSEYLITPVRKLFDDDIGSPVVDSATKLEKMQEATISIGTTATEVQTAIVETKETVAAAKETVSATKEVVKTNVSSAANSARRLARQAPRSRKEANQLAYQKGQSMMQWMREGLDDLVAKHQLGKKDRAK